MTMTECVYFIPSLLRHTWWWLFFIVWWQRQPKACSATWWITADYQPDTIIWSVSWVILSSLTLHLTPVPARSTTVGFQSRRDSRERNETYFIWTLSRLFAVASTWNVWEDELLKSCRKCMSAHVFTHTQASNSSSPFWSPPYDWGHLLSEPLIDRAPTFSHPPPPSLPSVKHDRHLLLLCRSSVGPDASACLPIWLTRPCLGSYLQVKTCRLHSVSLYWKERKGERSGCHKKKKKKSHPTQTFGPDWSVATDQHIYCRARMFSFDK